MTNCISVLAGGLLLLSASQVLAQQNTAVPVVAYLGWPGEPADRSTLRDAFFGGLTAAGRVPGKNIHVEVRRYGGDDQLKQAITELLQLRASVLVVGPPGAAAVARAMTKDVAIVCGSCGDPVENGLAASLSRPGGNVTGLASLSAELVGKRLAQIKELLPGATRVAVLTFPANPGTSATLKQLPALAKTLRIDLQVLEVRGESDYGPAFRSAASAKAAAILLQDDPLNRVWRTQIAEHSLNHRIPVSVGVPEVAEAGALISYGPDRLEMIRRAAAMTDRILKGAKPSEMPFEQAAKLELVLNMKTAKALGIAIPPVIRMRVDRTIE